MRLATKFVLLLAVILSGCAGLEKKAGFDPEYDTGVALKRAEIPRQQAGEDLRKQDPRTSLSLQTDPSVVEGYMVLTVEVKDLSPLVAREIEDPRRPYDQYVAQKIDIRQGAVDIVLQCKDGKPSCSKVSDVRTMKVPLYRKVWRAAVYGQDDRIEKMYDAVYRPGLQRFAVLIPLDEWVSVLGKEVRVLSAYGDFAITRDGVLLALNGEVAKLPAGTSKLPVKGDDMVRMTRNEPAGKFFLDVLAGEFPLPAPFHSGTAHPDLYLGAMKLTQEDNSVDCWVGHGGGSIVIGPIPGQAVVSFVGSFVMSLPRITARDCGVK